MARLRLSLASLAVDEVHEQQKIENQDGEFDELYHQLDQPEPETEDTEDEVTDEPETDETELEDSTDTDNEESNDESEPEDNDSEKETDEKETESDEKDSAEEIKPDENVPDKDPEPEPKDDKETETALESCLCEHKLAMELLVDSRYRFATESIVDSGKSALQLGFKYAPVALKYVSKTILKALEKTAKGLLLGSQLLVNYIKKRNNSYKHYLKKIESAKKTLELIKEKELEIPDTPYNNANVITKLKIADQLALEDSLNVAKTFAESYFETLSRNSLYLANSIKGIINLVITEKVAKPSQLILNIGELRDFHNASIPTYATKADSLTTVVYHNQLPGDLLLIAHVLSKNNIDDDNLLQAYRNIKMFFGVNEQNLAKSPKINYLTLEQVDSCLTMLEELCHYGMSQENSFKQLNSVRKSINASFSKYVEKLFKFKDRMTVRESMVEIITPSVELLDRLYIGTTVQVDDYLGRVINASLVYINDSLKLAKEPD